MATQTLTFAGGGVKKGEANKACQPSVHVAGVEVLAPVWVPVLD